MQKTVSADRVEQWIAKLGGTRTQDLSIINALTAQMKAVAISKMLTPVATSAQWTSLNWDSLNWDSLNWDSLNWDSLNWDSVYWEP